MRSGVVLARSSQPEVGWLGWRNTQDESLLHAIDVSCAMHRGSSTVTSELNHVDSVSSVVPSQLHFQTSDYQFCFECLLAKGTYSVTEKTNSGFPVSSCSAVATVRRSEKIRHLSITFFLGSIIAKKLLTNGMMYVKV